MTGRFDQLRWKRLGLDVKRLDQSRHVNDEVLETYKTMEHLDKVWEGELAGVRYQVMMMNAPTFESVVPKMGTSVCMAWWKGGDIKTTPEFDISHKHKIIFVKDDYTAKEVHVVKMQNRYPDYKILPFADIIKF